MANFNRERIPERQPHAKGGGAFGHFEVTNDVSAYTKAAVFQPGTETDMLIRFSTVAGERGSPDTWRDPRGFALKFYTTEGNYDMVGNNTPVFFIRDPMKFQHFIRSQKRRADNNLRDHDMQWDFWTLSPGVGAPGDLADGRPRHPADLAAHERLLQPHLHVDQRRGREVLGEVPLQDRPGHRVLHPGRGRPDGRRWTPTTTSATCTSAIERGEFPSWTLKMQIMPFEDAKTYRFNPFDLTKVWPHGDYPLHRGRPADAEPQPHRLPHRDRAGRVRAEQPGAGHRAVSPDKMLLGPRVLLRRRAPRPARGELQADPGEHAQGRPVHSYSKDGAMRIDNVSDPVYAPNSKGGPQADPARYRRRRDWHADGEMVRTAYTLHAEDDDWGQAGTMVREVLDDAARDRLVGNIVGHLLNGVSEPVLQRAFEYWRNVDKDLGDRIEAGRPRQAAREGPEGRRAGNPARAGAQAKA